MCYLPNSAQCRAVNAQRNWKFGSCPPAHLLRGWPTQTLLSLERLISQDAAPLGKLVEEQSLVNLTPPNKQNLLLIGQCSIDDLS